jgi:hypothetical protein
MRRQNDNSYAAVKHIAAPLPFAVIRMRSRRDRHAWGLRRSIYVAGLLRARRERPCDCRAPSNLMNARRFMCPNATVMAKPDPVA